MNLLDIVHPAGKTLVDIAKSQDAEVRGAHAGGVWCSLGVLCGFPQVSPLFLCLLFNVSVYCDHGNEYAVCCWGPQSFAQAVSCVFVRCCDVCVRLSPLGACAEPRKIQQRQAPYMPYTLPFFTLAESEIGCLTCRALLPWRGVIKSNDICLLAHRVESPLSAWCGIYIASKLLLKSSPVVRVLQEGGESAHRPDFPVGKSPCPTHISGCPTFPLSVPAHARRLATAPPAWSCSRPSCSRSPRRTLRRACTRRSLPVHTD